MQNIFLLNPRPRHFQFLPLLVAVKIGSVLSFAEILKFIEQDNIVSGICLNRCRLGGEIVIDLF